MENIKNRNIIIGIVVLVLVGGAMVWYAWNKTDDPAHYEIPGAPQEVVNTPQRLEFTYYGGLEGYTLLESTEDTNLGDPLLVKAYTIVDTERYMETETTEGIGDRIPAITILVFDAATSTEATSTATGTATSTDTEPKTLLRDFAESHSGYTAYGLRTGDAEDVRLDNIGAIRFTSTGPFASETYVVEHRNKYYVIIGQYESEESEERRAFQKLLTQIYFL